MDLKKLGNIGFITVVVIAFLLSIFYFIIHFFVSDYTVGVNNINDQVALDIVKSDDLSEEERSEYEERWFMEANYYSNAKENGIALQELRYNYFTSYNLLQDDYRSTGMQYLGEYKSSVVQVGSSSQANNSQRGEFYYYDTANGVSWSGSRGQYGSIGSKLNRNAKMTIKIDNRPFSIQLTGSYETYKKNWLGIKKTYINAYDYGDVFDATMWAIKSCGYGYGDYYIIADLSDYFSIYEYDTESGKYKSDNVTDIIKNYAVIKVHYDENGAKSADQSLYGCIACDPQYGQTNTEYWQSRVVYNLADDNLAYRYSEVYDGYFVSLSFDMIELLNNTKQCEININIDLDSTYLVANKINIIGLDYDGFSGVEINKLTITGYATTTIQLLDRCLYNTNIQKIERSSTITLGIAETAINNEYLEVVL